jgi:hypothetical protein
VEKLDKGIVLYFSPASIGRSAGARCGACWKFIRDERCIEVKGEIKAEGSCGLYIHGTPFKEKPEWAGKITQVTQREAGYSDDGDTHCGDCEYIAHPRDNYSPCERVEGFIEPEGCCNAHDRD